MRTSEVAGDGAGLRVLGDTEVGPGVPSPSGSKTAASTPT